MLEQRKQLDSHAPMRRIHSRSFSGVPSETRPLAPGAKQPLRGESISGIADKSKWSSQRGRNLSKERADRRAAVLRGQQAQGLPGDAGAYGPADGAAPAPPGHTNKNEAFYDKNCTDSTTSGTPRSLQTRPSMTHPSRRCARSPPGIASVASAICALLYPPPAVDPRVHWLVHSGSAPCGCPPLP